MYKLGITSLALCLVAAVYTSVGKAEITFGNSNPSLVVSPNHTPELNRRQVELLHFLMSRLKPGDTTDILRARHLETFYVADIDGKAGISADDTAIFVAREMAYRRGRLIGAMLGDDLDYDNTITLDELLIAGRESTMKSGSGRANAPGTIYTPEQIAMLAEAYAKRKIHEQDLDGDGRLTMSDIDMRLSTNPIIAPKRFKIPPDAFDVNSDGRITEKEMRSELEHWIEWLDVDTDGVITTNEIKDRRVVVLRSDAHLNRRAGPNQNRCILPPIASTDDVVVIHAKTGSAFIDLTYGGEYAEPVYMGEIVIPEGNKPLWIIASFGKLMLLRLDGATDRVAGLISVAASTGMVGHPTNAYSVKSRCHAGFLGIQIREKGQSQSESLSSLFARALRREAIPVYTQDTLGRLDLASGRNDTTTRLAGDDTPEAPGDARYTRNALYFFSPGGFHNFEPDEIAVPKEIRVSERPLLPLEAGLLQLIDLGLIKPVVSARTGLARRIPPGSQPPAQTAQERAAGSPLTGGFLFHKTGNGSLVGHVPLNYVASIKPRIPPGLNGTRGIRLEVTNTQSDSRIDTTPPACRVRTPFDKSPPSDDECMR